MHAATRCTLAHWKKVLATAGPGPHATCTPRRGAPWPTGKRFWRRPARDRMRHARRDAVHPGPLEKGFGDGRPGTACDMHAATRCTMAHWKKVLATAGPGPHATCTPRHGAPWPTGKRFWRRPARDRM